MKKFLSLCFVVTYVWFSSQTQLVFVYFKDKPNKQAFYSNPVSELSQKSLTRRTNLGISLNDQDAPIEQSYIQNIQNLGFTVTDKSKWLNGVAVNATAAQISLLQQQSYVLSVESFVKNPSGGKMTPVDKFKNETFSKSPATTFNYGNGAAQIDQVNLRQLHVSGFTGTGITIAVMDTGFPSVDTGSSFERLRTNGQIKGGYNFFNKSTDIYNTSFNGHGTAVLGIIGGYIDGTFVGSAPDAQFYLYATENAAVEIPEEELYWIQAAEEADRVGVDIITTSLGYNKFDDARYNYVYADMTGQKSFIARGAEIATQKGIFVLAANGNEAQNSWHYLLTPADNEKVFSIGGVTSTGASSTFSSFGPNANGIVKPDASARGTGTYYTYNNTSSAGSGTSFATPVAAGGVACLLQAIPASTSRETIREKLRQTASLFPSSTEQMGFGILNFGNALQSVLATSENTVSKSIKVYPNPAKEFVNILTDETIQQIILTDASGRRIKNFDKVKKIPLKGISKGIYFLQIQTEEKLYPQKIIVE